MGKSIRLQLICILCFIVLTFLFGGSLQAQFRTIDSQTSKYIPKKTERAGNVTRVDFMLQMSDGVFLDCTRFFPDETPPSGGWPALIYCHGYGANKFEDIADAEELAGFGYFTLVYSMRGQGISGGLSNLISYTEANDFAQVVSFVRNQTIVNDDRIGAIGGSQGGTIPLMSTSIFGTQLRCIVSDVTNPRFASDWMYNNSVKMTLLWTLSYDSTIARYNPQVKAYRSWILEDTPEKFDSLSLYIPQNRDFFNEIHLNQAPLMISTVWQDKFFNTQPFIEAIPFITVPNRMYFGTFDAHGADYYEAEDDYHVQLASDWLDYYLTDYSNGVLDSSKYVYASSSYPREDDAWTWKRSYSDVWPPAGTEDVKLYFWPNGRLREIESTVFPDTLGFENNILDPSLTMLEAVNREFTGPEFDAKFQKTELYFETDPLLNETKMVGTPFVNVHYLPGSNKAQFNYQIYEIKAGEEPYLITRANFTERNITPGVIRQLSFYGTSHSHIFSAGSKIRVILTNLDNIEDDPFLRTNPYVLPSLEQAKNIIFMNPANPTYIRLPLIGFQPNSISTVSSEIPQEFRLEQNYPNPFNPSTTIKFSIAASSPVKLKVYDMLGKQVAELVNANLGAGTYEYNWDASSIPSGVYFYKLEAEGFSNVKKMLLMK
jgi:predicted acyl esterase